MAARIALVSILLASASAADPCAPVVSGTTKAPWDKNVVIGASVAGGAALAIGGGVLAAYEANKDKSEAPAGTPISEVVPPPAPDLSAKVVDAAPAEEEEGSSASCGTWCWVGVGLLSLCLIAGLIGALFMACKKGKTAKKKKSKAAAPAPVPAVEEVEVAPLLPLLPSFAAMPTTTSYVAAPAYQYAAPTSTVVAAPVTTSVVEAAPITTAYAAPVAAQAYTVAAPMFGTQQVAAPAYAMQAVAPTIAYEAFAAPTVV